jgi:hypothetical protein
LGFPDLRANKVLALSGRVLYIYSKAAAAYCFWSLLIILFLYNPSRVIPASPAIYLLSNSLRTVKP